MFHHTRHNKTVLQLSHSVSKHQNYEKTLAAVCRSTVSAAIKHWIAAARVSSMARGCLEMLAAVFHDTASVDQCSNLTTVTSVTTYKNWWQLGFHPKFAIDTLSFYSVGCLLVRQERLR